METNATNTNGFRCLQEIMKQVSEQMLKYIIFYKLYKMKYDGKRRNLPLLPDSKAFISFALAA